MVLAYNCEDCGFMDNCDVSKSGERLCPDCGMAVTGITTKDHHDYPEGQEEFIIQTGYTGNSHVRVTAYSYESAYDAAQDKLSDDEWITDISLARSYPHL